jgi:hypothetical protein
MYQQNLANENAAGHSMIYLANDRARKLVSCLGRIASVLFMIRPQSAELNSVFDAE